MATSRMKKILSTLEDVKKESTSILSLAIPIMKSIEKDDNDYTDALHQMFPKKTREELTSLLRNISIENTSDAHKIIDEYDDFLAEKEDGTYGILPNPGKTPFLTEVWNGDLYGVTGVEALEKLLIDLRASFFIFEEEENLIKTAIKKLKAPKEN